MELFHGTTARFERFSLEYAARPGMAGNGFLGVWLAVRRELAAAFGGVCLTVRAEITKAYRMSVSELQKLNAECNRLLPDDELDENATRETERRFYSKIRDDLLAKGFDTIEIVEWDERVDMVVAMLPERLTIL
jgi:hypothetical protein